MRTRVHIGIRKKAGNIPILSRRVGTTPTRLNRPIGINNDPIVRGVVAACSVLATFDDLSSAPFSSTIFYILLNTRRKEIPFLILRRLFNLLYNVGTLPSYVHHIL